MRKRSTNILVVLVVLAIAVLPVHFAFAAHVLGTGLSGNVTNHDAGMDSCHHAGDTHATSGDRCDSYSSAADSDDDCCGDNCSGAQIFFFTAFNFHTISALDFERVWLQHLPDPIVYAEIRPPIFTS